MSALAHALMIGPGRMGLALAYALKQADAVDTLTVCGRRSEPPAHPLFTQGLAEYVFGLVRPEPPVGAVFLAVPDAAVAGMAEALAALGPAPDRCAAFHLSGALSTEVLAPLHARGYAVGSFHPLQAIAHPVTGAERLRGAWIAVTGAPAATGVARRLAASLGSSVLTVSEARRPHYHAAAVLASNFLPPVLDVACRLLGQAGISHDEALGALLTLVRGTLENVAECGVEESLTGPIRRGDLETVELHLRALEPADRRLYSTLGLELLRLGGSGLPGEVRRALIDRFNSEIAR